MNESVKILGNLKIVKKDKDNNIVETRTIPNLVVNTGKAFIAERVVRDTANAPQSMALGDDATTPIGSQTALVSELSGRANALPTVGTFSNTISSNTITFTGTFAGGLATGTLREAAIFDSPNTGGTMLCRTTFSDVTKGASDIVTVTWNITVA